MIDEMKVEVIRVGWGGESVLGKFALESDAQIFMEAYGKAYQGESYVFSREIKSDVEDHSQK